MTCLHLISSLFGLYLCLCVLFRSLAVYSPLCWHSDSIPKHSAAVHLFVDDVQAYVHGPPSKLCPLYPPSSVFPSPSEFFFSLCQDNSGSNQFLCIDWSCSLEPPPCSSLFLSAHLSSSLSRPKSYLLPGAELTESASIWLTP